MAVTVKDRRTILTEADSLTNWSGGDTLETEFAEGTASVARDYNIATGDIYYTTGTSFSLTDTIIYVYSACNAIQNSWTTWAHSLFLGDGTNQIAFAMAGGDRDQFKHADGPVLWQNFVLDGSRASEMDTSGYTTAIAGSFASLALGSITQAGGHYITQSKALGGGNNCFVDIIRYGNDGIRITGGTSGDPGNFYEVILEDRSTDNQKAHGMIRELTAGVYGIQGPITFGETAAGDSWFEDTGIVLAFEDRWIGDDKYYFNVEGNGTPGEDNYFTLTASTIKSAGPYVKCDFSASGINEITLTSVVFASLGNEIYFGNDGFAESGHYATQCTFTECGLIDPGKITFSNNTIASSTNASGALLIDEDGTDNISSLNFISDGTGHAIYMPTSGTYEFVNFTYDGYGATGTTDASVFNDSSGVIIIQVNGGDSPTYRNGAGSTTYIQNSVNLIINVEDRAGAPIQNASVRIEDDNETELMNKYTDVDGVASETYNYLEDTGIIINIRKSSPGATRYFPMKTTGQITSTGFTLTAVMAEDNIAAP